MRRSTGSGASRPIEGMERLVGGGPPGGGAVAIARGMRTAKGAPGGVSLPPPNQPATVSQWPPAASVPTCSRARPPSPAPMPPLGGDGAFGTRGAAVSGAAFAPGGCGACDPGATGAAEDSAVRGAGGAATGGAPGAGEGTPRPGGGGGGGGARGGGGRPRGRRGGG